MKYIPNRKYFESCAQGSANCDCRRILKRECPSNQEVARYQNFQHQIYDYKILIELHALITLFMGYVFFISVAFGNEYTLCIFVAFGK